MTGDARHGRRDNGLVAADYAAAGDVDPRVGEHVLDVLAVNGIAAYLRPSTDTHPITRSSMLPDRPTDRLYVDRTHLSTAREYLARLAADAATDQPEQPADEDPDEVWAQIVAGYDTEVEPPMRSWPAAEDLAEPGPDPVPPDPTAEPTTRLAEPPSPTRPWTGRLPDGEPRPAARGRDGSDEDGVIDLGGPDRPSLRAAPAPEPPSLLDGLDTFGADLPDDEEGYTPPAPPPLPRPSLPSALGVAGVVIGLIIFLRPDLMPLRESVAMLLGFTAVVGGFGTLVWRLRPGDDDDDDPDPDNGARV